MKRISRACIRCRRHKAKCVLASSGHVLEPPCHRCVHAGVECVLATSNRGGYRRRKTDNSLVDSASTEWQYSIPENREEAQEATPTSICATHQNTREQFEIRDSAQSAGIIDDTFASTDLHNTLDALKILSKIAGSASTNIVAYTESSRLAQCSGSQATIPETGLLEYHLVKAGALTPSQVLNLVERFATIYHPFYPIVPEKSLNLAFISGTARSEPYLLTAICVIGSKDMANGEHILGTCAQYMSCLITEIIAGKKCGVDAIEALLLLAEWEPQCSLPESANLGYGQEDMAAWMHIGLAVRLAYSRRLDRTQFYDVSRNGGANASRERLAWAACYLSDRQISVRIGRPFACRGLEPSIVYGRYGFPTVGSQQLVEETFSSVFRARLELTQIFTNVHEVLYCNMGAGAQMMLVGSYAAYLDDFRGAIAAWNCVWGSLTCPQHIKILLQLSYEYLRLYANAFAFQAAALRTISPNLPGVENGSAHSEGPGSLPEARFMFESIDAAKSLLTIVNNYIPSAENLNQFPIRFPLFQGLITLLTMRQIWTLNAISHPERASVRRLIGDAISSLRKGTTGSSELGARYANLLEILWKRVDRLSVTDDGNPTFDDRARPFPQSQVRPSYLQDGFSWLDLEAIGEFVLGGAVSNDIDLTNTQRSMDTSFCEGTDWGEAQYLASNEFFRIF
ncbi:hypothetical protein N7522_000048 [Penicillium canescens]|uniref:uncharacterized protein n=1 Tax=Penicillium canescens TaxID=5083 RepID=UPI0026DF0424|nr:uncharacterized protein N7446_012184 [Penicillium canescens]KAJ6019973.1 hypothetical protein N7522_000048 [Penicillium canescens]KAJ6045320.1 hypothetical protein N7446_012184 [Penicillium canescens]